MQGIPSHAPRLKAMGRPKALGNRLRSGRRTAGGRRQALTMSRRTRGLPPARRIACPISMGHYQGPLVLRVHVVWFGEMPFEMDRIFSALEICDLFVSIGTSGSVYPAAGFVQEVRMVSRAHTVELNLEPSEGHSLFAERHYGPASRIVPEFVARVLREGW